MAAVVREGSFGKAAASLLVTQPAVSERVRHLERVIGRSVFDRTSRGAVLTAAGEGLLPYAQRCLALAEEALESARSAGGVPRFVIAVHSTFAPRIVPAALGALAARPRRVAVRDAHSDEVQALVLDGVADVGFAIPGAARRGLRRVRLRADPVVCVAAPDHPMSRSRSISPRAFADSLVAVNRWGEGADEFIGRLGNAGVDAWRIRECGDAATAVELARGHAHVAFVTHVNCCRRDRRWPALPAVGYGALPVGGPARLPLSDTEPRRRSDPCGRARRHDGLTPATRRSCRRAARVSRPRARRGARSR